jgi:hypothetical protein
MKQAIMEPGDSFVFDQTRSDIMARWRQAVELAMTAEEIGRLTGIARIISAVIDENLAGYALRVQHQNTPRAAPVLG